MTYLLGVHLALAYSLVGQNSPQKPADFAAVIRKANVIVAKSELADREGIPLPEDVFRGLQQILLSDAASLPKLRLASFTQTPAKGNISLRSEMIKLVPQQEFEKLEAALTALNSTSTTWREKQEKETQLFEILNPIAERLAPLIPGAIPGSAAPAYTRERFLEEIRVIRVRQTLMLSLILADLTSVRPQMQSVSSEDQGGLVLSCATAWTARDLASYRTEDEQKEIVERARKLNQWMQDEQRDIASMPAESRWQQDSKSEARSRFNRELQQRREDMALLNQETNIQATKRKELLESVKIQALVTPEVLAASGLKAADLANARTLKLTGHIVDFSLRPGFPDLNEPSGIGAVAMECESVAR